MSYERENGLRAVSINGNGGDIAKMGRVRTGFFYTFINEIGNRQNNISLSIQLTINNLVHCQFNAEQESLLLRIPNLKQSEMQIRFLPEMGKPTRMNTFVSRM